MIIDTTSFIYAQTTSYANEWIDIDMDVRTHLTC